MALFLLHAKTQGDRNSGQWNSVLVEAATEQDARDAAAAAAPNGEARVRSTWGAVNLGSGEFPGDRTVLWMQGRGPCAYLSPPVDSGGNPIS